jgi:hypothetical protein
MTGVRGCGRYLGYIDELNISNELGSLTDAQKSKHLFNCTVFAGASSELLNIGEKREDILQASIKQLL